jgi:hypothetical protein
MVGGGRSGALIPDVSFNTKALPVLPQYLMSFCDRALLDSIVRNERISRETCNSSIARQISVEFPLFPFSESLASRHRIRQKSAIDKERVEREGETAPSPPLFGVIEV